jgi:hypothetical protein
MTPAEGRIVGNYTLRSLIGRGGMSEVYAAEHTLLGDLVAVKLLRSELATSDAHAEAFIAEAARTRAIQHANVVRVLDVGRDTTGWCYLVMERVDGENLAARLQRVGRLAEVDVRRIGAAIADGAQAAHDRGIVHRDLKPANVMLGGDVPKIVDFGISKHLGNESAVTTGRQIGTPAYMAPEQLTGGLIAPCVDVWALGVILFEALTGRLPFAGFVDGRCPQLFETAPAVGSIVPVSGSMGSLVARCLERDPGRRPASMAAVARELRAEAGGDERITQDAGPPPVAVVAGGRPVAARRDGRVVAMVGAGAIVVTVIAAIAIGRSGGTPVTETVAEAEAVAVPETVPVAVAEPVAEAVAVPEAETVEVEVRSTPSGAEIVIDGERRGVTPARVTVAVSTSILVRRSGYRPARIQAERTGPVDVRLVRRPRASRDEPSDRETLD